MKILVYPLLVILLAGCSDRTPLTPTPQNIRPAKLMTVKNETTDVIYEFSARVEAFQTIDVSFEVGGPLASISVREGQTIEKGAVIAALDPTDFQLTVRESELQLRLASQDLNRKKKVLAENGIAKSLVEDAQSNYELQRVRLRKAKEQLQDTKIAAPFEAYVSRRYFDNFVNVRAGEPIVRLLDLHQLLIVISVPENLAATVGLDQVIASWVEFSFAPDEKFVITYRENRGEADPIAQTYSVSFTMEKPEQWNVLPGMTATAKVKIRGTGNGAMLVPATALVPSPDGSLSIWLYDPQSHRVTRQKIETGAPQQSGVPVYAGLKSGDQIVVTGASQLQPGMLVRPLE